MSYKFRSYSDFRRQNCLELPIQSTLALGLIFATMRLCDALLIYRAIWSIITSCQDHSAEDSSTSTNCCADIADRCLSNVHKLISSLMQLPPPAEFAEPAATVLLCRRFIGRITRYACPSVCTFVFQSICSSVCSLTRSWPDKQNRVAKQTKIV